MAGHNKWSQIKHRKGSQDIKRSRVFTKISKEITVSIKSGGTDPDNNFRLRSALEWAKSENMPSDNINRAIIKSTKQDSSNLEQKLYEGYSPGNNAIIVESLTDNANRSFTNLKTIFNKNGGTLGQANSVQHLFRRVSFFTLNKMQAGRILAEDTVLDIVLEADADDVTFDKNFFYVTSEPKKLNTVYKTLKSKNIEIVSSELIMLPISKNLITDKQIATKVIKLINAIEEDDDVQKVYTNFDVPESLLQEISAEID